MKKTLATLGLCTAALLVPAAVSIGDGSPRDSAIGSGTSGDMRVAFAAHGGPTTLLGGGDPVTGHFRSGGSALGLGPDDPTEFQFEGPVTCLNVQGNEARLIYPIKQGRPDDMENMEIFIFVKDDGKPEKGEGSNDLIGFEILPDTNDPDDPPSEQDVGCLQPFTGATSKLDKGDITVRDETP